jgi:hypothetical protein
MSIGKVTYDTDTSEVVIRKKLNRMRAPFSVIGPMTNVRVKDMKEDVFDLLDRVSKKAFSVFNNLKYNRSLVNNVCNYVATTEMDKTDKETLSRNIAELKSIGLIRSIKCQFIPVKDSPNKMHQFTDYRRTYVINPELIRCRDHDEAEYLWDICGGGPCHTQIR